VLFALGLIVATLSALAWLTRDSWQQAELMMPSKIATADRSPRLEIDLGSGRVPSLTQAAIEINGEVVESPIRVEDRTVTAQLPPLDEGSHQVKLTVPTGVAGRSNRAYRATMLIDTTPPPVTLGIQQRPATGKRAPIDVSVGTEHDATASIIEPTKLDVRLNSGTGSARLALAEGRHRVVIESRDSVGNVERTTSFVVVDATPPIVGQLSTAAILRTSTPRLAVPVRDNGPLRSLSASASFDGRGAVTAISDGVIRVRPREALSEGEHTMRLVVTDKGGNSTEQTASFVVDSTELLGNATLRVGARGDDVELLQRELLRPGAWKASTPEVQLTGIYDGATQAAVQQFQSEQGLAVDGVAGPFTIAALTLRITIDQSAHRLILFRSGKVFRTYRIAVGQPKYPTPNGIFRIVDKQKNPTWTPPDSEWAQDAKVTPPGPDNPLGTRWMGLDEPSIGIHGTNDPQSLGYSVSHGCVRMAMADVEELFDLVAEGTQVEIRP
jgi:lipoprotein-anchoring transpeptidase ErfK/SrfK